jgi:hypothetical protein
MEWIQKDRIDHAIDELPNWVSYIDLVQEAELFLHT